MDTRMQPLHFGPAAPRRLSEKMEPAMAMALAANFGSIERWRDEFVAMGKALGGGSGWVLPVPILALDMYEPSYHVGSPANARRSTASPAPG